MMRIPGFSRVASSVPVSSRGFPSFGGTHADQTSSSGSSTATRASRASSRSGPLGHASTSTHPRGSRSVVSRARRERSRRAKVRARFGETARRRGGLSRRTRRGAPSPSASPRRRRRAILSPRRNYAPTSVCVPRDERPVAPARATRGVRLVKWDVRARDERRGERDGDGANRGERRRVAERPGDPRRRRRRFSPGVASERSERARFWGPPLVEIDGEIDGREGRRARGEVSRDGTSGERETIREVRADERVRRRSDERRGVGQTVDVRKGHAEPRRAAARAVPSPRRVFPASAARGSAAAASAATDAASYPASYPASTPRFAEVNAAARSDSMRRAMAAVSVRENRRAGRRGDARALRSPTPPRATPPRPIRRPRDAGAGRNRRDGGETREVRRRLTASGTRDAARTISSRASSAARDTSARRAANAAETSFAREVTSIAIATPGTSPRAVSRGSTAPPRRGPIAGDSSDGVHRPSPRARTRRTTRPRSTV